jgi:NAD+ synthase (glutamine-hydrolysing)
MSKRSPIIRLALAQTNLTVGDIQGNSRKVLRWIDRAARRGADLVAFPELTLSGYPPEDLLFKSAFLEDCRTALDRIVARAKGPVSVVGYPSRRNGTRNSAAVIYGGRVAAVCDKIELPNYGVFDERRYFVPGRKACVLLLDGVRIGLSICEDIWFEEVTLAQVARGKARIILNVSSSPYNIGKGAEREALMRTRAVDNGVYVAYVNLVGGQDELVFDGHSLVVGPDGTVIARGRQFEEDLIFADIDLTRPRRRRQSPGVKARLPVETAGVRAHLGSARKKIEASARLPLDFPEEIYKAILTGTADYVLKNGFKKVIVGLSGGIDSALVATIAVDALGAESVIGVSMPSRYSSRSSVTDARALAGNLGIEFIKIGIDRIFSSYLEALKPSFKGHKEDVTEENIQARIRGNILMALSNKFGWLVLTTGNKSEVAVGYCTLYGDLAGGFAILKDVPKTLVYELAAYRNMRGKPVIPKAILTKPPSAELKPDQKDEDTLPPYEILDPILNMYVVEDMAVRSIIERGFPDRLVKQVVRLVDRNEYKRRQGPPGIKITPRAFGKDRRMPITNRYGKHLR